MLRELLKKSKFITTSSKFTNLKESRDQRETKDKLFAENREYLEDGISHVALGCKPNLTIFKQFKADSRHLTVENQNILSLVNMNLSGHVNQKVQVFSSL